jgi:NitT/TauT family transport system substrate-binding protein
MERIRDGGRRAAGLAAAVAAVALAWGPAAAAEKVDVRFRLDWFPKGVHALFWTAKAKGFYDEQSLNVTIVPGDGSGNTIKLVGSGEFDFGFADGPTGIVGRSRGIPVVAIGAVHQKNPQGIVSLKESGIAKPKDLEGKTFGIQPQASTYPFWLAFAKMNSIDRGKVREFNMPGEVPVFILEKRVQGAAVLYDNELIAIESKLAGPGSANFLLGDDYGFKAYGHSLFTGEKMMRERPDVVRRFLAATKKGMQYAMDHQQEAIDILVKQFRDLNRTIAERQLAYGAKGLFASPDTEKHGLLWMVKERWDLGQQVMLEQKVSNEPVDIAKFFTTQFLQ